MPKPKLRWFHLTPGRLLVVLLAVEAVLLLSERFHWFPFNEHKGWTVLIALAAVGVFLLVMLIWFITSLIFHWRFQFSIRSLLVLTVAVAIPCSWLAVEMKWAKENKKTVEAIRKIGGEVYYDEMYDKSTSPPAWLREQLGDDFFFNVFLVTFYDPLRLNGSHEVSDPELERLNGLAKLQSLFLGNTKISDAGLEHLKGMTQLQSLDLNNTKISDAGLEHLKGLTQLQSLDLNNTKVSDVGMKHLKGLTQLQELNISNTRVSDVGAGTSQRFDATPKIGTQ